MSTDTLAFFYTPLNEFLTNFSDTNRNTQIVPYYVIRETGDMFAMLTLNRVGIVQDFNLEHNKNKSFVSNVVDSIKKNSLCCINLSEEDVISNSFIGYSTHYDVSKGKRVVSEHGIPAVFIKIEVDTRSELNNILRRFKTNFAKKLTSVISNSSDITNLIYMPIEDLYYLCRFTTYKINKSSTQFIEIDMEEEGFPALSDITAIYKADSRNGDIPCSSYFSELENCCPEVDFYRNRSISLFKSLLPLFNNDVPIMV